jgi:hypothetical protein
VNRPFVQVITLISMLVLLSGGTARCAPVAGRSDSQTSTTIYADWNQVIGSGPTYYGVEYGWIDQDSELFLERYRLLNPNALRVQVTQEYFEMVNDNDDPDYSEIDFDVTFTLDAEEDKQLTYGEMLSTLAAEFPDMHFHINLWLAARWNASDPDGYLGLGGAFPPLDYAEHREFVREFARWLVDTCGIAPERLSFSFVNEPNLIFFFNGTQADLVQMAAETRAALDEISPLIQMMGLDEVHGTGWTDSFYTQRPAGCCEAWTFHAYERGVGPLWTTMQTRIEHLNEYGPVWATEFADTTNGSPDAQMDFSTRQAALGFAEVVGRLWGSGVDGVIHFRLADMYVDQLGGWAGHGLFADWRGTKSDGEPYAVYPAFWVFANLYGQLGGGEIVSVTAPSNLVAVGARRDDALPPRLALWMTNPTQTAYSATIEIASFPTTTAGVSVLDNLSGDTMESLMVKGDPLVFAVLAPAHSSYTVVVKQSLPLPLAVCLPIILKLMR